jgi:xanthine dehydrogenase/oxidase
MGSLKNKEDELEQVGEEAILYVNGVRRILPDGLAHMTLLEYLRGTTWFLKL